MNENDYGINLSLIFRLRYGCYAAINSALTYGEKKPWNILRS